MSGGSNDHSNHRKRMFSRYLKEGISRFDESEILEVLLYSAIPRRDTHVIGRELLDKFGTMPRVFDATFDELTTIKGIGGNSAAFICFMGDVIGSMPRRVRRVSEKIDLSDLDDLLTYVTGLFSPNSEECTYILYLDQSGFLLYTHEVSIGCHCLTGLNFRDIAEKAIALSCHNVILAHNHPNGYPSFSSADVAVTRSIMNTLKNIEISLDDHIVVARGTAQSLRRMSAMSDLWP